MSEFTAASFAPLSDQQPSQVIARPSLSYWQDAWNRLRANRRALVSLYIVIGLLLFTVFGPVVWPDYRTEHRKQQQSDNNIQ